MFREVQKKVSTLGVFVWEKNSIEEVVMTLRATENMKQIPLLLFFCIYWGIVIVLVWLHERIEISF